MKRITNKLTVEVWGLNTKFPHLPPGRDVVKAEQEARKEEERHSVERKERVSHVLQRGAYRQPHSKSGKIQLDCVQAGFLASRHMPASEPADKDMQPQKEGCSACRH
eukprot:1152363-Pelagomonas_calceolata.AAC.2